MSDELEAFLRRAAQKRQKRRPAEIVLIEPGQEPVIAEPIPRQPLRATPHLHQGSFPDATPSEIGSPIQPERQALRFDESARTGNAPKRTGTSDITQTENATRLADHQLGRLQRSAESQAVDHADDVQLQRRSDLATEILDMLQTPQGGRRAILLQEILTPPVHRWE